MKKIINFLFVTIMSMTLAFVACNKDDTSTSSNSNSNNNGIFVIEAKDVLIHGNADNLASVGIIYDEKDPVIIATAEYKNRGFKLTLPKTIEDKYLFPISSWFETGIVSDEKTKIQQIIPGKILGFDNQGYDFEKNYVGYFDFRNSGCGLAAFLYVDRNCTVTGEGDMDGIPTKYDCKFNKGWNTLYIISCWDDDGYVTTKKPSDWNWNWIFHSEDYYK